MDLSYSVEETAFRAEVRSWIEQNLPTALRDKVLAHRHLHGDDYASWIRLLARRGWSAAAWPVEYGGPGWNSVKRHIWDDECGRAGAPPILPFGISMLAPVLMKYGSAEQKSRYLPRILDGSDWWCQGYSEPGAGSDLASLRTRAEREGDHYVVNGQKAWTTLGQYADMMFCLVRTSTGVKRQEGISFLVIDMKSPGITVRPTITLDEHHEVNEVFLDDVKVPVENLIGEEGQGWAYAKYLLGYERTGIAGVGVSKRELSFLKKLASRQTKNDRALLDDPVFRAKVAVIDVELMALEVTVLRMLTADAKAGGPGPQASMLKVKGTEIQQALTELMVEAIGPMAAPFDPAYLESEHPHSVTGDEQAAPLAAHYFAVRKTSIYGGTNEIQRNILAQMLLGT